MSLRESACNSQKQKCNSQKQVFFLPELYSILAFLNNSRLAISGYYINKFPK